jgi:hypothetical protein
MLWAGVMGPEMCYTYFNQTGGSFRKLWRLVKMRVFLQHLHSHCWRLRERARWLNQSEDLKLEIVELCSDG